MDELQYPVGRFSYEEDVSPQRRRELIDALANWHSRHHTAHVSLVSRRAGR
jgi:hypothetical protein